MTVGHRIKQTAPECEPPKAYQIDGLADSLKSVMPSRRVREEGDIPAIFVHAGAGYHSVQNEHIHLEACAGAVKAAMTLLKRGGTAVDAVELAIRTLEDSEITNAGFGSNLALDGTVECDATIVDHHGRSGAVGAMGHVANPIHVARLILEGSTRTMSLRRVPPNLLVGQGAVDYAFELGVSILPADALVSFSSRERWLKWRKDLLAVQAASKKKAQLEQEPSTAADRPVIDQPSEAYTNHMAGTWNESQPYSPLPTTAKTINGSSYFTKGDTSLPVDIPSGGTLALVQPHNISPRGFSTSPNQSPFMGLTGSPLYSISSRQGALPRRSDHDGYSAGGCDEMDDEDEEDETDDEGAAVSVDPDEWGHVRSDPLYSSPESSSSGPDFAVWNESSTSESQSSAQESGASASGSEIPLEESVGQPSQTSNRSSSSVESTSSISTLAEDNITDTVGAIAVDRYGNIAAGSSSGGIGMKHKGRAGPAALVGIGTHVFPTEAGDKNKTCVATVMSGTGEHMATTMAASVCARRLYFCEVKGKDGRVRIADEEAAIRAFVERDFMSHPSVRNSHSAGAIGVMGVKRTKDGLWLHFAHNTDSFALASMTFDDLEPKCVMSRGPNGPGPNKVITGARSIKCDPYRRFQPIRPSSSDMTISKVASPVIATSSMAASTPALITLALGLSSPSSKDSHDTSKTTAESGTTSETVVHNRGANIAVDADTTLPDANGHSDVKVTTINTQTKKDAKDSSTGSLSVPKKRTSSQSIRSARSASEGEIENAKRIKIRSGVARKVGGKKGNEDA